MPRTNPKLKSAAPCPRSVCCQRHDPDRSRENRAAGPRNRDRSHYVEITIGRFGKVFGLRAVHSPELGFDQLMAERCRETRHG